MLHTCISGIQTWAQSLAPLPGHIGEGTICEPLTPLTAPIVSGSRAHLKMSVVLVPPLRELLKWVDVGLLHIHNIELCLQYWEHVSQFEKENMVCVYCCQCSCLWGVY